MRKALGLALIAFSFMAVGLVSQANAQAISDVQLFAAASQVSVASVDQSATGNQQMLMVNPSAKKALLKISVTALNSAASSPGSVTGIEGQDIEGNELEGPEKEGKEGPDLDGPGGSTHQFEGQEEGNH
ncbi:MAG: hypothetical protein GWP06_01900 [Actinobacteria bacterium]|nr:hypothetical protein [Actinomycetota bacterium]